MTPNFTTDYKADKMLRNLECIREFYLIIFTYLVSLSYKSYIFFCEFGVRMFTSLRGLYSKILIKTEFNCMLLVLLRGNPFKIFDSIIQSVSIFVINFSEIFRVRNIGHCYQSMYKKLLGVSVAFVKHCSFITMSYKMCPEKPPFTMKAPNLTVVSYFVESFISKYVFHGYYKNSNTIIILNSMKNSKPFTFYNSSMTNR